MESTKAVEQAPIRVALEPIYNALNSLSLLNETAKLAGLNTWVTRTATTLTPECLHTNKLIFTGLRAAVIPWQNEPDFPTYLKHLAARDPLILRDQLLADLGTRFSDEKHLVAPSAARMLEDRHAYLACVEYTSDEEAFDTTLQMEVHTLLNDPQNMQKVIVEHLEQIWQTKLASEWKRVQRFLENQVRTLVFELERTAPLRETFRAVTGRELPAKLVSQAVRSQEIVLVPTWHSGLNITQWVNQGCSYLFFSEPSNYDLAWRTRPISRTELRVRLDALADDTRLRIIELLAQQDELLAQEIIQALELSQSSISRHLKQLVSAGYLCERRGENANKTYRLSSVAFDKTALALNQLLLGQAKPTDELETAYTLALRRFVDREGRVTCWPPSHQRDKLLILEHLTSFFEAERVYSEQEVNNLLQSHSTIQDNAALRRGLFEYRFINRTRDGSRYWLIGTQGPEEEPQS
jgi:hypothetical protein